MRNRNYSIASTALLLLFTVTLPTVGPRASGQTEIVISNFSPSTEGEPCAGVILDAAGNLYGTTSYGGTDGGGTVFELLPAAGGGWTQEVLYSFQYRGGGGFYPLSNLIFDSAGNLYGTASASYDGSRYGTVYKLTHQSDGSWTETALHDFSHYGDGQQPQASLIFDAAGNLYGTTVFGGVYHGGIAFELKPLADGTWTEKVLHNFGNGKDGYDLTGSLIFDAAGNLYGTTISGGSYGQGIAFELSPGPSGGWSERVLHEFGSSSTDGASPYGNMIFDTAGNLYGTTGFGGTDDRGTVFELSPKTGGGWKEKQLYSFNDSTDGGFPVAGVTFDGDGNLYGTTDAHGPYNGGSVFELTPEGGSWKETLLYTFTGKADGGTPEAGVILDGAGNIFGTTINGGSHNGGTVFEIIQ